MTASGINHLGVVVGGYTYLTPGDTHATSGVFLDDHGKLTDLGTMGSSAFVRGFNDQGQVLINSDSGTSSHDKRHFSLLNDLSNADPQSAAQHLITSLLTINGNGDILALDRAGQQVLLKPLIAAPASSSHKRATLRRGNQLTRIL